MKRASFLRSLIALPFIPAGLKATPKDPFTNIKGSTWPEHLPDPLVEPPREFTAWLRQEMQRRVDEWWGRNAGRPV
jgi:hypothetical protein